MSLTSFLRTSKTARALLDGVLRRPPSLPALETVAPPVTTSYGTVGTAVDYTLRWGLERHYTRQGVPVHTFPWIARLALPLLQPAARPLADSILHEARVVHGAYMSGEIAHVNARVAAAALGLTTLDFVYRTGSEDPLLRFNPRPGNAADVVHVMRHFDPRLLQARRLVALNPHFGVASDHFGGADADFLLDGTLFELKTTIKPAFTREHLRQLVGYVLTLHLNGGRLGNGEVASVDAVGIYFARQAYLVTVPLADLMDVAALPELARAFADVARAESARAA